jgi:predicted component of type VI protein secretion system
VLLTDVDGKDDAQAVLGDILKDKNVLSSLAAAPKGDDKKDEGSGE